ncbi:MAG: RNA polymerase sigma factor [Cyclobacteriaceae bacterium]|nr:RNA polymerase sigma factor [Cyclobacteriaceae bacterium HetDA_MAG_MS6]
MNKVDEKQIDASLAQKALDGDKTALNSLIDRHYSDTFNICLKMLYSHKDAEDVNQEIWIKIVTQLKTFQFKSAFKTWMYRIAVNHVLDMKKRSVELEIAGGLDGYGNHLANIENEELNQEEKTVLKEAVVEAKLSCMSGMLMCLNREQRLFYILGDIFKIDHNMGSEIFEVTPEAYRKKISRARKDLFSFMDGQCSLVNKDNPCTCEKKTKGFIRLGYVNPDNLMFNKDFKKSIYEKLLEKEEALEAAREDIHTRLFQDHPYEQKPEKILEDVLSDHKLHTLLRLN